MAAALPDARGLDLALLTGIRDLEVNRQFLLGKIIIVSDARAKCYVLCFQPVTAFCPGPGILM
jgi:hypothetical protein